MRSENGRLCAACSPVDYKKSDFQTSSHDQMGKSRICNAFEQLPEYIQEYTVYSRHIPLFIETWD